MNGRSSRLFKLMVLSAVIIVILAACKTSDKKSPAADSGNTLQTENSGSNTKPETQATAAAADTAEAAGEEALDTLNTSVPYSENAGSVKPAEDNSPVPADSSIGLSIEDQLAIEEVINSFGTAVENGDYETAQKYCTKDYADYLVSLTEGTGVVTDSFSNAIANNYPIKLVAVEGYYDEGTNGISFELKDEKPTSDFLVTFEIEQTKRNKINESSYTQGVKGEDGIWRIGGLASGR